MKKNTTRVTAIVGTTMALVIAGTAAVSAAGPRDRDDRGMGGFGKMGPGAQMGAMMPGGRGMGGFDGGMRGFDSDIERTERSVQSADGTITVRMEQGVVDSAAADSLSFSLGSGEAVTVAIDEDTQVVGFEEQEQTVRGWSRKVVAPAEIEAEEIEAGAEVIVTSDSEDDSEFVASRIVVKPAGDEEAEEAEDTEADAAEAEEAVEETTEDAAATDA